MDAEVDLNQRVSFCYGKTLYVDSRYKINNYENRNVKEKIIAIGNKILSETIRDLDRYIIN